MAGDSLTGMDGSAYYKVHPMFHPYPEEKLAVQSIDQFGPVGIGIELLQPAFKMRVRNVEEGSPAAATGKLKKGQLIESINGRVMKDMDPRQILGDIIDKAEASDGLVKLVVKDNTGAKPEEVIVKISVLGAYSDTWPLNCPKSDKIVRNMADFVTMNGTGSMGLGALFLLSTGEDKDLEVVSGWMKQIAAENKDKDSLDSYPWYIGYGGPALCEYYLRTGDESILHTIKLYSDHLKRTMYNGAWGGKGIGSYFYMAGGHMNAAGVHCVTFMLLAKECGVEVNEYTLQTALKHFYRFSGRGNVAYGDGLPEQSFVDNGKTGGLAFAMAAAASLTPKGEKSIYAKVRDYSATKSFYSTSWMLHGHTGGGIGEIWRGGAMGHVYKTKPTKYRQFMDNRGWFYDISRHYDGSFGILGGGGGYDDPKSWGIGMGLVYTIPRKTLRMTGGPKTKYCKSYELPERPWGTAADDMFYSLQAASVRGAKPQKVDAETLVADGSWPVYRILKAKGVTDETLLKYAHHPEIAIRRYASDTIKAKGRDDLTVELLKSKDPRVRHAGIMAINKRRLSDEMVELMLDMVNDHDESWCVTLCAMEVLGSARAELIVPHVDRLVYWLKHDDWWINRAAMTALTKASADKRYYKTILPIIGEMVTRNTRAVALSPLYGIVKELQKADPEVQAFAIKTFSKSYTQFPDVLRNKSGAELPSAVEFLLGGIANNLAALPGGYDALFTVAKKRSPDKSLPHKEIFMKADASKFGPKVKEAMKPIVLEELIPEYIAAANHVRANSDYLNDEANSTKPYKWGFYYREPRMAELVRMYNRIDVHDYDWHVFGPDLNEIKWDYHTFDPDEKKLWAKGARYRKVTYPKGMENWFAMDFDAKKAGWESGFAPFGQVDGKKVTDGSRCRYSFCRHDEPVQTFWDKEVLIMRGKIKFPSFKEGYRYRLLIGGMSNVNRGEGYRVYVNGKQMMERDRGVGKREGGQPLTYYIDKAWWPGFEKEVTIAATSFLQLNSRTMKRKQHFSIWLEEMKVPPLGKKTSK